jgi:hypothetical protein
MAVMRGLLDSADPNGNFNPGKIIAAPGLDQGNSGSALKKDAPVARKPTATRPAAKRTAGSTTKAKVNAAK